jgi:hypothetical protein
MSYPGPGPIYRHCIVCGRPFRVWRCELLRNRAKFCTRKCYSTSRRLFSEALADGRLESILQEMRKGVSGGGSGQLEGILQSPVCQEVIDPNVPLWRLKAEETTSGAYEQGRSTRIEA